MSDILIGILAVLVGAVFCFRGFLAMRFVISIWGAFAGLNLGAALVAVINNEGFLVSALGWTVGIVLAVVFSVLAYLYYAVAVTMAMASVGFFLGAGGMVALGVTWNWVVVLVGAVVGLALALLTLAIDLPAMLLVLVSVLGGAVAIVGGVMLLVGTLNTSDFSVATTTDTIKVEWWWYAMYVVLLCFGLLAQMKMMGQERQLRQQWQPKASQAS